MLAGFLRRAGRTVRQTVDLEVPANAEIVLEGYIAKESHRGRALRRPHRLHAANGSGLYVGR
jgi:hypothetical protein